MAFKLRSPLHKEEPKLPVANDGSNEFKNYQAGLKKTYMSSKDSGVGAYPDPQTGERTFYDKKHQSYDMKKGVTNKTGSFQDGKYIMNKPKPAATKPESPYPASQGGSPMAYRGDGKFKGHGNINFSVSKYMNAAPGTKWEAATSSGDDMPKTSGPKKLSPGGGVRKPTITDEGYKIPGTKSNDRPTYERPGAGSKELNKPKNTANTNKNTKKTEKIDNSSNTKPIRSSDSGDLSGGYLKNTKNFSLGVDTKLNVASMPKFERTVTNARSADYDLVKAKGRGKIDKLKSRLARRQGKVENKVEKSLIKINARQQRQGTKYAGKMKAAQIKSEKGKTDPGYFESQKKLDAFEKAINSPKATPRTSGAGNISSSKPGQLKTPKSNQTVAKPSIKLNTSKQTSTTISDNRIKKGAKEAKGGRINERVSESTYQSATGFAKLSKKAGPSGGMQRGMPKSSTSITQPNSGPRATTVKVESGPSKRKKFIKNAYNNIRK
jgi:hypothetical protein